MAVNSSRGRLSRRALAASLLLALLAGTSFATPVAAVGERDWVDQVGGSEADSGQGVARTDDAVYLIYTIGNQGPSYLRKYLHNGDVQWERTFGDDTPMMAVAADASGIYIAGLTSHALPGQPAPHQLETYVARYSPAGSLIWARQFVPGYRGRADEVPGAITLALNATGVFIGANGFATGILRHYDRDGNSVWTRPVDGFVYSLIADAAGPTLDWSDHCCSESILAFNNAGDVRYSHTSPGERNLLAVASGGGFYDAHHRYTDTPTVSLNRAYVTRYNAGGIAAWTHRIGGICVSDDFGGIQQFANRIYVTWIEYVGGCDGPRVTRWAALSSTTGEQIWAHNVALEPDSGAFPRGLAVGPQGGYIAGSVDGALAGQPYHANLDAFLMKFNIDTAAPLVAWEVLCPGDCLLPEFRLPPDAATLDLHWSGSDKGSGIDHFQLQQTSNDGANWTNVLLGEPRAKSVLADVKPGDTYRFRLRAVDRSGNASKWKSGPEYSVDLFPESDTSFGYDTDWKAADLPDAEGGTVMTASDQGAKATLHFKGNSIGLISTVGPDRGKATVYLDGIKVGVIDLFSSVETTRMVEFSHAWAHPGSHVLSVVVRGTAGRPRVDIDAVQVVSITP